MAHHYRQLSIEEREKIQTGLWEGKSLRSIAHTLGRSPATLSRELARNCPQGSRRYTPRVAQEKAHERIMTRGKRFRLKDDFIREYVHTHLHKGWSPEQIAGRISRDHASHHISHEAIYQYIYAQYRRGGYGVCTGADLRRYLRQRHKVRGPKKMLYAVEKAPVSNRIWIDERPAIVATRKQPGHWEGDSILSRQGVLGINTLVERTSGLVLISKLGDNTSRTTAHVIVRRLQRIPRRLRRTLTLDNGHEHAQHTWITRKSGVSVYFAHPYHSWERGSNENTNGLIRWYLPKGTNFATIPQSTIAAVEHDLNTRPRKRLRWKTPLEVFNSFVLH
jgi:transposase, IS30 family